MRGHRRLCARSGVARPKCRHPDPLSLDGPKQCCGLCLPSPTRTGSASCSLASMISRSAIALGRCTRPRVPRQATGHWPVACGNCGNSKNSGSGEAAPGLEIGISLAEIAEIPTRRAGRGSGNSGNPLGCRYRRCFSNAVAGTVGLAESAETPSGDSSRGVWRVTGHGTVRQSVLASLRSSAAGGNP